MKEISIEIYNKLTTGITDNTYHNYLPANIDNKNTYVVYELSLIDSKNLLDSINYENTIEIRVKILSQSVIELYDKAEDVIDEIFNNYSTYKSPILNNTVPIFYDDDLIINQYTLLFNVIKVN